MELIASVFLASSLILLLLSISSILFWQKYSRFHKLLSKIPGPPSVPLFGTIFDYFGAPRDELFKRMRKKAKLYYPIYKDWVLHIGAVSIFHPDDIQVILSSPKYIKKNFFYTLAEPWLEQGLITSSGQHWRNRRKILTPTLHFSILKDYLNVFNKGAAKLVRNLEKNREDNLDVTPLLMETTIGCVMEIMGTKQDKEFNRKFAEVLHEACDHIARRVITPWYWLDHVYKFFPKPSEGIKFLHGSTEKIIRDRQKIGASFETGKKMSIVDLLLKLQREGADIDDRGIREEVFTFTASGFESTATILSFMLLLLANNKNEQEEVRQEIIEVLGDRPPKYDDLQQLTFLERCLKECLRLYPVVPYIGRLAEVDIKTSTGHIIPKGSAINIFIYDVHRNPEVYPDPEKFDPDRFLPENTRTRHPFAYIPFSAGPRNCIGQKFMKLEVKAAVCAILRKFNLEPITKPEDLVFLLDIVLRPKDEVYVKFVARQ